MTTTCFVVPGDIGDLSRPSGGNTYDHRVRQGLMAAGWPVREMAVPGTWPRPDIVARSGLAQSLSALPDGTAVLLDGLVGCGVPDVVIPQANRLRIAVLVHLPLGDESGLSSGPAAELDALERETLHAVDAVIATSSWAARRLTEHHGLTAVHVVPPGVDPAPLAPGTDGASRLLCVASVTPRKGLDRLVTALASVSDLSWTCDCVGPLHTDPVYVARLRQQIDEEGLSDRVWMTGPQHGEELSASYAATDLAVLPSLAETYGMVITESLSRGIPVLATNVGGVPEAMSQAPAPHGTVPGILVPPDDPEALAAALRRWLTDHELRQTLRSAARLRRDVLDGWETTSQRMGAVLDQLHGEP
ncbi:glycosyltransferase family 4 protein [Actinomadura xylanilytica]|uniref:glycosyltransferase family 4 protein n=1 Tax=Actinomadura xylanilytica TaxID=887459 RepID=UPI00255AD851|nr:glycosyltransferase family 4 protein [Actinomadura xylanilytica]MDL4773555.1 glycosyltransferase family 4 protein [Actinomadura xylanilytica]